jgi:hypothetical protein
VMYTYRETLSSIIKRTLEEKREKDLPID